MSLAVANQQQSSAFLPSSTRDSPENPKLTIPPMSTPGVNSSRSTSPSAVSNDNLSCCWNACKQKLSTPELLYEHLCEWHVGRKNTNNINLTCQWGLCRTTTAKREHMASHMFVHVPLRPHEYKDCGKCFKRPQDLKKHVKSHADSTVLTEPPEEPQGGYNYRLLSRSGPAPYYDQDNQLHFDDTVSPHQAGQPSNHYPPQPTSTSCGLKFIPPAVNNAHVKHFGYSGAPGSYEHMRTLELVDDFFDKAKRRQVDPSSYAQIDRFLIPLRGSIPLPNGSTSASDQKNSSARKPSCHSQGEYRPMPELTEASTILPIHTLRSHLG